MAAKKSVAINGSDVGIVGDGARVEGGIHFHTIKHFTVYQSHREQQTEDTETDKSAIGTNPYIRINSSSAHSISADRKVFMKY